MFVVSNQSGIGRGYYSENSVNKLHQYLNDKLIEKGAHIDSFLFHRTIDFQIPKNLEKV